MSDTLQSEIRAKAQRLDDEGTRYREGTRTDRHVGVVVEAIADELRALAAKYPDAASPAGVPDPKAWMLENVGPVPQDDEEARYKWHTTLGVLTHYKLDCAASPSPAEPNREPLREALEYYADPETWRADDDGIMSATEDAGDVARAILAAAPDPSIHELVANMICDEIAESFNWKQFLPLASRICALFEGAGGLRSLMERVSREHPIIGSYEEDARYNWPARWDALWELELRASPPPADIPPDRTPEGIAYEERGFLPPAGVAATYSPPHAEPGLRDALHGAIVAAITKYFGPDNDPHPPSVAEIVATEALDAAIARTPPQKPQGDALPKYPVELRCAELEERLKALDKYLRHHDTCLKAMTWKNTGFDDTAPCDCGLEASLAIARTDWACDDCMMRDMTEAEGNAHHASTGHSVSSK
jgi:hypothetical protein